MSGGSTTISLRALEGNPLDDERVRNIVAATAEAIAERQGIMLKDLSTTSNSITVTLQAGRIEAFGFMAELRRLTADWYSHKHKGAHLWGSVPHDADGEEWRT